MATSACPPGAICLNATNVWLATVVVTLLIASGVYYYHRHARREDARTPSARRGSEGRLGELRRAAPAEELADDEARAEDVADVAVAVAAEDRTPPSRTSVVTRSRDVALHTSHILDHPLPPRPIAPLPSVLPVPSVLPRIATVDVPVPPPLRSDPNTITTLAGGVVAVPGVPINVPTRGYVPDVQQVGILTNTEKDQILPLYGRPVHPGSSKWLYHTATDKFQSIKIPVHRSARNCSAEYGCDELYDNDSVTLPAYGDRPFTATIYALDAPRYIPYV